MAMGYDCLMIPGAIKTDGTIIPDSQCGNAGGLATAGGANANVQKTVCSKTYPFRFEFHSDTYEGTGAAMDEANGGVGFKVRYFQTTC